MTTTPKLSTPPTPPSHVETTDLVPDYNLLGQTDVQFDSKLSPAYVAQIVEAMASRLERMANDGFSFIRSVAVGPPNEPEWRSIRSGLPRAPSRSPYR
jgi:hypothetical protein